MVITYSCHSTFKQAITKTFDGQHPCCLCKAIKQGRAEEKEQDRQQNKPGNKLEPGLIWEEALICDLPCERAKVSAAVFPWESRENPPPKPRPRASFSGSGASV